MTDEVRPRQAQESPNGPPEDPDTGPPNGPSDTNYHVPEEPAQGNLSIFDERFDLFMTQFGQTCEDQGVKLSLAVVIDPQHPNKPIVFYRGNIYQVAQLTKEVLDQLRAQVMESLR